MTSRYRFLPIRVIRVRVTFLTRLLFQRLGWFHLPRTCGASAADGAAAVLASTDGTANTIAPNIADKTKNFFIFTILLLVLISTGGEAVR